MPPPPHRLTIGTASASQPSARSCTSRCAPVPCALTGTVDGTTRTHTSSPAAFAGVGGGPNFWTQPSPGVLSPASRARTTAAPGPRPSPTSHTAGEGALAPWSGAHPRPGVRQPQPRGHHPIRGGGLSPLDRLPPLPHVLGRLISYSILFYSANPSPGATNPSPGATQPETGPPRLRPSPAQRSTRLTCQPGSHHSSTGAPMNDLLYFPMRLRWCTTTCGGWGGWDRWGGWGGWGS